MLVCCDSAPTKASGCVHATPVGKFLVNLSVVVVKRRWNKSFLRGSTSRFLFLLTLFTFAGFAGFAALTGFAGLSLTILTCGALKHNFKDPHKKRRAKRRAKRKFDLFFYYFFRWRKK